MATDGEAFSLRGLADERFKKSGLTPVTDDEANTRSLEVDTSAWESALTAAPLDDLRERWNLVSPEINVSFACCVQGFSGAKASSLYETPLRVTQTRGDWADLAPVKTHVLIPPGYERYRVRVWATDDAKKDPPEGERLLFVDGHFENDGRLVALGRDVPGKILWPGPGITMFAHWVGRDAPGFLTLAVRFDGTSPA